MSLHHVFTKAAGSPNFKIEMLKNKHRLDSSGRFNSSVKLSNPEIIPYVTPGVKAQAGHNLPSYCLISRAYQCASRCPLVYQYGYVRGFVC